jgi:hypothetical protein
MVAGYRQNYRRHGIDLDAADLERLAVHDLELIEAAKRTPTRRDMKPRAPRVTLESKVAETGSRLIKPPPSWQPALLHANPMTIDERWSRAVARIKRIQTEGCQLGANGVTFIGALGVLAKDYATIYACFLFRNQSPTKRGFVRNQFDGMPDADVARLYRRLVEDVCDRSTGVLGSWYVT